MFKFLVLFFISIPVFADEWMQSDTYREVTYQTIAGMDWLQTRTIAKHPETFYELNAILGKHPSTTKVDVYFVSCAFLHYEIAKSLPEKWRARFQYISIGFEGAVVARNFHLGVKMDY